MPSPILQVESLTKAFQSDQNGPLLAVANISFTVTTGEFLGIVGPSGCGKTTLLHLLAGLVAPTKGQIWVAGEPLTQPRPEIGVVFQKPNLMPWRTVLDNLILPLQIQAVPPREALQRSKEVLALVGLSEFATVYPKQLSGGMEQRVAVARALIQQPKILLLDEPFGALDALTRERLNLELLRVWQSQNLTVVMVTHDIREAVFLANRVLVLSQRPATVAAEFNVDLPRPRPTSIEFSETFGHLVYEIRQSIKD